MYNESGKDFIVADLSLFTFENVFNFESLITQLNSSNIDSRALQNLLDS